ncbi:SMP-30/gluconolactonase/LRE family protein [Sphingomonas sp. BIUV-7]|uniref:SMP-30/gluconolactonase/LRE family protein n=1 Tax=Sphingomonas natans TaxID=3063330 RepID=A0ABT8Y5A2_9SPHN|nr:SMP-30/gluconolactonase/LRE family protein [Sphingomonas sp. BIUV-7]MDO6412845.1 SMP-30/gluconolactonase/LRE family protein [Sphingomonas sp. BIUV-7]
MGEGPLWDDRSGTLWFGDILSGRLHSLEPETNTQRTIEVGGYPGFLLLDAAGGFVLGRGHALERFDGERVTGETARVEMRAGNRLNDGTVDPAGRIWFGSMDFGCTLATGAVHLFAGGKLTTVGGECAITNGPAVTADGRLLYHVDTLAGQIWRFDIGERDTLIDGVLFATIDPADGTPDGVVLDSEDHLWVGLWGGWSARRYAPDGKLVETVRFPCANVTKIAFGGPDLKTAYATTARDNMDDAALADQPLAGGLFAFPVDVPGRLSGRAVSPR